MAYQQTLIEDLSNKISVISGALPIQGFVSNLSGWNTNNAALTSLTGISARFYLDTFNNSNAFGSSYRGRRFRGTADLPSGVLQDDVFLQLVGDGFDGSGVQNAKISIFFAANEDWVSGLGGGTYMAFRTTPSGTTAVAERMRITHDGRVGLGTPNPFYTLDVSGSGNFTEGLFVNGVPVNTGSNGGLSQSTADALYYPRNNPSGFATGVNVSSLVSNTSFGDYTGKAIKIQTALSSGVQWQFVSFPSNLASVSTISCEFENSVDLFIYNHAIYGVTTSGFNVGFSDILSTTGYRLHSLVNLV